MLYRFLADSVLVLHLGFIVFALVGGLLALRWRVILGLHLPCAAWAVLVQVNDWTCPLTPLENHFRRLGGEAGYDGGFIEHYVVSLLYPAGLTPSIHLLLGLSVLAVNLWVYWWVLRGARVGAPSARVPAT